MYTCWKRKTTSHAKSKCKRNESEAMASKDCVIRLVMGCKIKADANERKYMQ